MNRRLVRNGFRAAPLVAALFLALGARVASAVPAAPEIWLRAASFVKLLPDGQSVTMWGYAQCTPSFASCADAPTVPGPALKVPAGAAFTIHLFNDGLPEGVSVTIPGQPPPNGSTVTRNPDGRIRAFTHEAAPGGTAMYTWDAGKIKAGTYLYQSGSHPAVQVQMGLYGALESDQAASNAYGAPDPDYATDVTLLYSEIDPALHAAVAANDYGPGLGMTSTVDYQARYFLVNGEPYAPGAAPVDLGTTGERVHFRLLNAGIKTRLPAFAGITLTVIAEDGNRRARYEDASQVDLFAGKTVDAFATVPAAGYYPVYDRALGLTNANAPGGGMLVPLRVVAASSFPLGVSRIGLGSGRVTSTSLPGGIDCGTDCTETYNAGTAVSLVATPVAGSYFRAWGGDCSGVGECVVTLAAARNVTAEFRFSPGVRVFDPNGGEIFPEGSFTTIRWSAPANARHFALHYSTDSGSTWKLIDRGVAGNTFVWRVPQVNSTRGNCRVRVRAFNAANALIAADSSDANFRIQNVVVAATR